MPQFHATCPETRVDTKDSAPARKPFQPDDSPPRRRNQPHNRALTARASQHVLAPAPHAASRQPSLFRREAKLDAGHVHCQMQAGKRTGARVVVGSHRHRHTLLSELRHRWTLALLKKIERAGEQYRHRAALRHRLNTCIIEILNMIGRQPFILADQRRAAKIRQLFYMPFYRDPERRRPGTGARFAPG